jgi:hypothetical protein
MSRLTPRVIFEIFLLVELCNILEGKKLLLIQVMAYELLNFSLPICPHLQNRKIKPASQVSVEITINLIETTYLRPDSFFTFFIIILLLYQWYIYKSSYDIS